MAAAAAMAAAAEEARQWTRRGLDAAAGPTEPLNDGREGEYRPDVARWLVRPTEPDVMVVDIPRRLPSLRGWALP